MTQASFKQDAAIRHYRSESRCATLHDNCGEIANAKKFALKRHSALFSGLSRRQADAACLSRFPHPNHSPEGEGLR